MLSHLRQGKQFYVSTLALMFPMIIQNLITNTLSLCDTFMVGMLGETELAAVTLVNTPFFVLMLLAFGVQSGSCVLVAQYAGKGDYNAINRIFGMGVYTVAGFCAVIAVAFWFFPLQLTGLLTNNATLIAPGAEYAKIIGFSYIFSGISLIYIGVQRSLGNSVFGMYLLGCSGILNVMLNYVLIFGKFGAPRLGVAGAAIATLICRILEVAIILLYSKRDTLWRIKWHLLARPGKVIFADFFRYALPVVANELLWSIGYSSFTIIMGYMQGSQEILAAATIVNNIDRIVCVGIFAAGNAAAVIIGREIGLGNKEAVFSKAIALNFVSLAMGLLSAGAMLFARFFLAENLLYPMLNLSPVSRESANFMLIAVALFIPLRSLTTANIVGVFRGGGDVKFSMLVDTVPMYIFAVPMAALSGLVFGWGIAGVYLFRLSDEVLKLCMCYPRVMSKKWINDVTRD